jgi:hypothetical protein
VAHATVQYCCEVRQPKLQSDAAPHCRPVSSAAQYSVPPMSSHTVPVMHVAFDAQVRVHTVAPPGTRARHTSGAAQALSEAHGSSSCALIVPPVLDVLLVVLVLVVLVVLVVLELLVDAPVPELEELVPELLVVVPVAEELVLLPLPPEPVEAGTHWELTLHTSPGGQSLEDSAQSCLHVPPEQ